MNGAGTLPESDMTGADDTEGAPEVNPATGIPSGKHLVLWDGD